MIRAQVAVHRTADPSFECPKFHRSGVASREPRKYDRYESLWSAVEIGTHKAMGHG
jgi:hypothetical protein